MRLVITGALGHIGSRLIHNLRPDDFEEVVLFDNLSTQRYVSLFGLPLAVPFRFIEGDVGTSPFGEMLDDQTIVIHLAAVTTAALSRGDEDRMETVNFAGTARVALACARARCRLFMPSTTSVYGELNGTVDEESPLASQPHNPYAATKLRAEQMLQALAVSDGLKFVVGRFGTIYDTSVGMRFHTAVNKFCWQASLGQPLSVWRTAMEQSRPFLDLDDAVRAIGFVCKRDLFDGRVYNVVSQNATVGAVVALIREVVPDVQVELVDSPMMNQLSYAVSTARFRGQGFAFRGDLRAGIQHTLALLRGLRQGPTPA